MANICLLQTTAHNDTSGKGRKTIEWLEELYRILGRRPASTSHFLLQSGTEMQLKVPLVDESDGNTECTTVPYNYTAHLMKCRQPPQRPDTNTIIIVVIRLPISVATYRDTRKSPLGTCACRSMRFFPGTWSKHALWFWQIGRTMSIASGKLHAVLLI